MGQDAEGEQVVDVIEGLALFGVLLGLLVDRVEVLDAPAHVGAEAGRFQGIFELASELAQVALAGGASGGDQFGDAGVGVRFEVLEAEIFERSADLPDAEPGRQRGVDLDRLARDALLLVRRQGGEGAHVVEAVGELDDDDADVFGHRDEHLAQVFGLGVFGDGGVFDVGQLEGAELGHAVDQLGDVDAEFDDQVVALDAAVFHHVVEQGSLDGRDVKLEFGAGDGGGEGVFDVWVAGAARVAGVGVLGVAVGAFNLFQVGGGEVSLQDGGEVVEGRVERRFWGGDGFAERSHEFIILPRGRAMAG